MEAASEKKKKRGRPPVFSPEYRAAMGELFYEVRTHRGMSEIMYRQRAYGFLIDDARFSWLADRRKIEEKGRRGMKSSILAALGRITDEAELKAVALRICELKPKTKAAVAMINRFRLGRGPEANYLNLLIHLEKALNAYLATHPATPEDWITRALRDLAECIEDDDDIN